MTAGVIILKEKVRVMNRTETKICPRCGNQVADGAKFCVRCGALMPQWNQQGQRAPQNSSFRRGSGSLRISGPRRTSKVRRKRESRWQ